MRPDDIFEINENTDLIAYIFFVVIIYLCANMQVNSQLLKFYISYSSN